MKMIKIKKEASIGELLTGISITITVIGLFFAWKKDRETIIHNQASEIRETFISINSRIDYWQDLSLHFYDKMDEVIQETAMIFRRTEDMRSARDFFWKQTLVEKNRIEREILNSGLEPYHLELLAVNMDTDSSYLVTIRKVKLALSSGFKGYIENSAKVIEKARVADANESAILGDNLRSLKTTYKNKTKNIFGVETKDFQEYLHKNIIKSDKELVSIYN